jgi:CRP-like cAMP-binding protein
MSVSTLTSPTPAAVRRSSSNQLLARLPDEEYEQLASELFDRPMRPREALYADGERLKQVLFPGRSVSSILLTMTDGEVIEVAMVGNEGLIGLTAAFGEVGAWGSAIVQVEGERALALSVSAFDREMARQGPFYEAVSAYVKTFSHMIMLKSACHGLHSAEARCCSWLLGALDRLNSNEFSVTHDVLATALGVRRPTVTLVLSSLVRSGTLTQRRGRVGVVDRTGLEHAACECYRNVQALFQSHRA